MIGGLCMPLHAHEGREHASVLFFLQLNVRVASFFKRESNRICLNYDYNALLNKAIYASNNVIIVCITLSPFG